MLGEITNVPAELRGKSQWSISHSPQQLKRPLHIKYEPDGGFTGDEALRLAKRDGLLSGFFVTEHDNLVLIDIDHVVDPETLEGVPEDLKTFISTTPTYWETSPSGNGLRGVVKIEKAEEKLQLKQKVALYTGQNGAKKREAELHFGAPWMTITCNPTSYSTNQIAEVGLDELGLYFDIRYKGSSREQPAPPPPQELPSLDEIRRILANLPLDQNPRIQRAYRKVFGHDYLHYEYWMKVMMAINNYAELADKKIACLDMMNDWSAQDTGAYTGYDDVATHWKSLENQQGQITYRTLFALNKELLLVWPEPKPVTKKMADLGMPAKPINASYLNFEALITYYDIQFHREESSTSNLTGIYLTCDEDIADNFEADRARLEFDKYHGPYNRDTLVPVFMVFLQNNGFTGIGMGKVKDFIMVKLSKSLPTINLFKMYVDTPFHELPEEYKENETYYEYSTFDNFFKCLDINLSLSGTDRAGDELDLYKRQVEIWLLGLIRNLFYKLDKYNINNCILVLVGKEQIRKTSFFRALLPERFRQDHVKFTTHGFDKADDMRDLAKISASCSIVIWDEVERYITAVTESNFKKVIDNTPQTIIDKYETAHKLVAPSAIYGGTSNQTEFRLGDTGSRRMFIIPIKWAHTDKINKICWHALINEMRDKYDRAVKRKETPWLLTEEELTFQLELHAGFKSKTDIDLIFEEMFEDERLNLVATGMTDLPFSSSVQADKSNRLLTTRKFREIFSAYSGMNTIKPSAFEKAARRFCSAYTGTDRSSAELISPRATVTKGMIVQGVHKRWVVPPFTESAKKRLQGFLPE